jgi:pSer/pThr/pTyr-binding forkhead associated (FHA) protein
MPGLWLVVQEGPGTGAQHPVNGNVTLGRDETADLQLPDKTISRRHAALRLEGETAVVTDLDSSNGTFVNGARIDDPTRLREGDSLQMGATVLEVRTARGETAPFPPPATPTEVHHVRGGAEHG